MHPAQGIAAEREASAACLTTACLTTVRALDGTSGRSIAEVNDDGTRKNPWHSGAPFRFQVDRQAKRIACRGGFK